MLPVDALGNHLARLTSMRAQTFATVSYGGAQFPLHAFIWEDGVLPAVHVLAGVHGDEPGGVEAALLLLDLLVGGAVPLSPHQLLVLPCLNPSGLADGTRSNCIGQDIN